MKNKSDKALIHKLIDRVDFHLHDSYKHSVKSVNPGSIDKKSLSKDKGIDEVSLTLASWGFFEVKFMIHFKKETGADAPFTYDHWLCFDGSGRNETVALSFNKQKLEELRK